MNQLHLSKDDHRVMQPISDWSVTLVDRKTDAIEIVASLQNDDRGKLGPSPGEETGRLTLTTDKDGALWLFKKLRKLMRDQDWPEPPEGNGFPTSVRT